MTSLASLANKYRSKTFDDLVGQDHISHILQYQVAHHPRQANYLFFGPRGTGKTSSARLFAKALNCLTTTDGNPCNECVNCLAITQQSTMDIVEIDAASHTGVENVRDEIIDKIMYRPTLLKKRVTIIDEVHMLSRPAFNALLKTMEEPSEWMVFILATTELHKVPDTIISRCQVFNFKKISAPLIIERLNYIAQAENISAEAQGLAMIADLSDGCMRDAVKYLDQISVMGEVTETNVAQFLGVVSESSIAQVIEGYRRYQQTHTMEDFESLIAYIEQLAQQGVDLSLFPKQLMSYADRHFHEDRSLYTKISILAAELLAQSKWYPHPLLLYKTILYGAQPSGTCITDTTPPVSEPLPSTQSVPVASSQVSESDNGVIGSAPVAQNTASKDDNTAILTQALTLLSSSLQKLLTGQADIEKIVDGCAHLIVTNPIAKMTLNKKDIQDSICSALTQTSGQTIQSLEIIIMTKEEYFAHQMSQ